MWSALTGDAPPSQSAADLAEFKRWAWRAWWDDRRTLRQRARAVAELAAVPWRFVKEAVRVFPAHSAVVSRDFRVSRSRQLVDLVRARVQYGLDPIAYYRFHLYRPERWRHAGRYVQTAETGRVLRWLVARTPGYVRIFGDKRWFERWCADHGFPTVRTVLEIDGGRVVRSAAGDGSLPPVDLFSKPSNSQGGDGTGRWAYRPDGCYAGADGRVFEAAALIAHLARVSSAERRPIIVQRALNNAAADSALTPGGLCTARITTFRLPGGPAEILSGIYRMPAERDIAADNFAAGGLAAPIDPRTGRLGPAVRKSITKLRAPTAIHPVTGGRIEGHQLAHWAEAVSLTLRAHDAIDCKGVPVIGWDVAITDEGPVLIEGNNIPCSTIAQMALDVPLADLPLLHCINAHLRERFASTRSAA